jgi:hypothetical protein
MRSHRPRPFGLLLALLALIGQLGFGFAMPRPAADAVLAATAICHANDNGTDGPAPAAPHAPDCVLCPLCVTVANTAFLVPTGGPPVPNPNAVVAGRLAFLPPPTAPPAPLRRPSQPRAPPLQT